jgi:hypothetical protein
LLGLRTVHAECGWGWEAGVASLRGISLTKLVYIGGYGRSGTTLLEYLMTESPQIVACGEISRHLQRSGSRKTCTCGRTLKECPVWAPFDHRLGKVGSWTHEKLTLALLASLTHYVSMVDSSKTAWGSLLVPFRLQKRLGKDFLLIHLVRHPTAVCWSVMRTPRRRRESRLLSIPSVRCLRTAVGWTVANASGEIFGWLYPKNYLWLRYEDLARSPHQVLAEIYSRLCLASPSVKNSQRLDNRHQLYGNSMRFRSLTLNDVKEDAAWKTAIPRFYRCLAIGVSWPLATKYRYCQPLRRFHHHES